MPTDKQIEAATKAMLAFSETPHAEDTKRRTRQLACVALTAAEQFDIRKAAMRHAIAYRIENAKAAFERRFGKSMMPLNCTQFTLGDGREAVKVFDPETGTWAEYTIHTRRVKRLREHDNA